MYESAERQRVVRRDGHQGTAGRDRVERAEDRGMTQGMGYGPHVQFGHGLLLRTTAAAHATTATALFRLATRYVLHHLRAT
ncbi:hypothetical protein [Streptomyces sp. NPDC000994]